MKNLVKEWGHYLEEKEKLNILYQNLYDDIMNLTEEDLNSYSYEDLKTIYNLFMGSRIESLFLEVYNRKRLERYPELKGVIYFEGINSIIMLNENEKKRLDIFLSKYRKGEYLLEGSRLFRENKDILSSDVLNELCDLGILTRVYVYKALCSCDDEFKHISYVSEEDYDRLKYWFTLNKDNLSTEEYLKLEDENFLTISVECENYDCLEPEKSFDIDSLESLNNYSKILFKLNCTADCKYDNL